MLEMPKIIQTPTPNYSVTLIAHDLIIVHMMEGGCLGSVAYLCQKSVQASTHLCMLEDGSIFYQLVPLQYKAWGQREFNGKGISIEIPGHTAQGVSDDRWKAAARAIAWLCHAYNIPVEWAQNGDGRGICQHVDLGVRGGGHVDACPRGGGVWHKLLGFVADEFKAFDPSNLPPFALHGLPNPAQAQLPPVAELELSHGGAFRRSSTDTTGHATSSGYPLGSMFDWQHKLRLVGANPQLGEDGLEGTATRAAIGVFQNAVGLPITKEVNSATWARLVEEYGKRGFGDHF